MIGSWERCIICVICSGDAFGADADVNDGDDDVDYDDDVDDDD